MAEITDIESPHSTSQSSETEAHTYHTVPATHQAFTNPNLHQNYTALLEWVGGGTSSSSPPSPVPRSTGTSFLTSEEFKHWATSERHELGEKVLWCHGPPGVGKSTLASVTLHHLRSTSQSQETHHDMDGNGENCVLSYFHDPSSKPSHARFSILQSLLRQIIVQFSPLAQILQTFISERTTQNSAGGKREASLKDLADALDLICSTAHKNITLIFDGVDEMEDHRDVKAILDVCVKNEYKVLFMSEDTPEIRGLVSRGTVMEVQVQADVEDMRSYVRVKFEEKGMLGLLKQDPVLEDQIIGKARGNFLHLQLLTSHLLTLPTFTYQAILSTIITYPADLASALTTTLARINSQPPPQASLAHRILGWSVALTRKLSIEELLHGLAACTEEGIDIPTTSPLLSPARILEVCGGLVIMDGQGRVGMLHSGIYTWLRDHGVDEHHEDLAHACLSYLTLHLSSGLSCTSEQELENRLKNLPFLAYAAENWREHILDIENLSPNMSRKIDELLGSEEVRDAAFQAAMYRSKLQDLMIGSADFEDLPTNHTLLHVAAYWGLSSHLTSLLEDGDDTDALDSQNWTPLHWACYGRNSATAQPLIFYGADIDAKDLQGRTPLHLTAYNGKVEIAKLLLEGGANHLERDINNWAALRIAASLGHWAIVGILITHHSNKMSNMKTRPQKSMKSMSVQDALQYCAKKDISIELLHELENEVEFTNLKHENEELYNVLKDDAFDLSYLWNTGRFDKPAPNVWRTMNKEERCNGTDSYLNSRYQVHHNSPDWISGLLHTAIRDGKLLAVKLLLELGADVNYTRKRTPLHAAAAWRKDPRYVEVLVEASAELEAHDYQGLTPLQQAVLNGFEDTISALLAKGANLNAVCATPDEKTARRYRSFSSDGGIAATKTPLMLACGLNVEDDPELPLRVVRMLLEKGADIHVKDLGKKGMSVVHYAAHARNLELLKLVIDAGADCRTTDNLERTAIHHLSLWGHRYGGPVKFDEDGIAVPGEATACLELLLEKCGDGYLNRSSKWKELYKTSYNSFTWMESLHTPLSLALLKEDWEIFHALNVRGALFKTNVPLDGQLSAPVIDVQLEVVKMLVAHGAKLDSEKAAWVGRIKFLDDKSSPSPKEVERLCKVIGLVMSCGFDLNSITWGGCTLLHLSVSRVDLLEFTRYLVGIGADPCLGNSDGVDSFILAILHGNYDALRLMLGHVREHPLEDHWTGYIDYLETTQDSDILSTICSAIQKANLIDFVHSAGTLLCQAAAAGHNDILTTLLKHDANSNIGTSTGKIGLRPLHFASEKGHVATASLLISSGADVNVLDARGHAPLHLAAIKGHTGIISLLLSHGADVSFQDVDGWQPLHFAVWGRHTSVARLLIDASAPLTAQTSLFTHESSWCDQRPSGLAGGNAWTGTPLHLAAMFGNLEIVKMLLDDERYVDVNARTDEFTGAAYGPPSPGGGPTALHIVLDTGRFYGGRGVELGEERLGIARLLVEGGADVTGVANHLRTGDTQKFEKFPELWDVLRVGISDAE